MAMSRSRGGKSVTSSSPSRIKPPVGLSRPAIIRNAVVLPDPDGPTNTMNSPSAISRVKSSTTGMPGEYALETCSNVISVIGPPDCRFLPSNPPGPARKPARAAAQSPPPPARGGEHRHLVHQADLPKAVVKTEPTLATRPLLAGTG